MKCEICGEPASAHFCDLLPDGTRSERHLCDVHARDLLSTLQSPEQAAVAMLPNLRALVTFIRTNNRMPTHTEMRHFNAVGDLSTTLPGTADFDRQLAYLETLIEFIEKHRQFPAEEELPDPF